MSATYKETTLSAHKKGEHLDGRYKVILWGKL